MGRGNSQNMTNGLISSQGSPLLLFHANSLAKASKRGSYTASKPSFVFSQLIFARSEGRFRSISHPCVRHPERISREVAECLQPLLRGDFYQNSGREPALSTLVHLHPDHLICRGLPKVMTIPYRPASEDYGSLGGASRRIPEFFAHFLHCWNKSGKRLALSGLSSYPPVHLHCRGSTTAQRSKCTCEPEMTILRKSRKPPIVAPFHLLQTSAKTDGKP
jgi:hypothetical protein